MTEAKDDAIRLKKLDKYLKALPSSPLKILGDRSEQEEAAKIKKEGRNNFSGVKIKLKFKNNKYYIDEEDKDILTDDSELERLLNSDEEVTINSKFN